MSETNEWLVRVRVSREGFVLDVWLQAPIGVLCLVGENGSGKTTLLRAMMGATPIEQGRMVVAGRTLFDSETGFSLPTENRGFAYVPQGAGLFPHLSVIDNICFGLQERRRSIAGKEKRERAYGICADLGCTDLLERTVHSLSGGEQQKIALARALLSEPDFLLLDEPLAALDVLTKREIRQFLRVALDRFALPAVIVTHDARDVRALGGRVCVLEKGRVLQLGSLEEIRKYPGSDFVRALCDEEN